MKPGRPNAGQADIWSATQTKTLDKAGVALSVALLQVIQQLAPRIDHANETTTGVVVVLVVLEVILQLVDVAGEQGHLDFRGTGIALGTGVFTNDFSFLFC